ncbi:hypothetical protein Dimus_004184 [Dionaea muscipula]
MQVICACAFLLLDASQPQHDYAHGIYVLANVCIAWLYIFPTSGLNSTKMGTFLCTDCCYSCIRHLMLLMVSKQGVRGLIPSSEMEEYTFIGLQDGTPSFDVVGMSYFFFLSIDI